MFFFFQAEDGIRDDLVTGVQTCALPICDQPDIGFKKNGYLFIVPPEHVATLLRNYELQRRMGVNVRFLEPAALKETFPSMVIDDLGCAHTPLLSRCVMYTSVVLLPCLCV